MKKIGYFSLLSALHMNATVMQNLLDFFPNMPCDDKPQSGSALMSKCQLNPEEDIYPHTIQKAQTHQNSAGSSWDT
jgi:hypothetical protein